MYSMLGRQVVAWMVMLLTGCLLASCRQAPTQAIAEDDAITSFVAKHWAFPVPPQGEPPADYSPLEASLDPQQCGICHPQQYKDWQTTLTPRHESGDYGEMVNSR